MVTLWTDQPASRLTEFRRTGVLHSSRELGWCYGYANGERAYDWMVEKMAEKIPDFSGHFPIWAYPFREDIRRIRWQHSDERVLIEFEAPLAQCLFSDYGGWHAVLNNVYAGSYEAGEAFDAKWEGILAANPSRRIEHKAAVEKSWESIFETVGSLQQQVCVDGLRYSWIKDVTRFKGALPK